MSKESNSKRSPVRRGKSIVPSKGKTLKSYKCPNCHKSFCLNEEFQEHLRSHLLGNPYECKYCHEFFRRKTYLQQHIKSHDMNECIPCPLCSETFVCGSGYIRHLLEHSGPPHICPICKADFLTVSSLNLHVKNHVAFCGICMIPLHCRLKDHIAEFHPPENKDMEPIPLIPHQKGPLSILSKKEGCTTKIGLAKEKNPKKEVKCFVCDQWLPLNNDYCTHLKAHGVFTCSYCPQFFAYASNLQRHEYECHKNDPLKCRGCNLELSSAEEFKLHQQVCNEWASKIIAEKVCQVILSTENFDDIPNGEKNLT